MLSETSSNTCGLRTHFCPCHFLFGCKRGIGNMPSEHTQDDHPPTYEEIQRRAALQGAYVATADLKLVLCLSELSHWQLSVSTFAVLLLTNWQGLSPVLPFGCNRGFLVLALRQNFPTTTGTCNPPLPHPFCNALASGNRGRQRTKHASKCDIQKHEYRASRRTIVHLLQLPLRPGTCCPLCTFSRRLYGVRVCF